jgi:hypothetical protein
LNDNATVSANSSTALERVGMHELDQIKIGQEQLEVIS